MTEEEIAKEYVDTLLNKDDTELDKFLDENLVGLKLNEKQAGTILGVIKGVGICSFLAGLKAGKPKWHDLRKAPNDLPEHYMDVVNQDGERVMYDYYCKSWRYNDADEYFCDTPIAWCEIPQFKDKE